MSDDVDHEAVALVQALIRNRCVSDPARTDGGHERANLDAVAALLDHPALAVERVEVTPGRSALIARLAGSPAAGQRRSLLLAAHLDVSDADPSQWRHDPFGGELIDGEVWGRGAVHAMTYLATMALALRRMAEDGVVPAVDVDLVALPDRADDQGAGIRWLIAQRPDLLGDWAVTEPAGYPVPSPAGLAYVVGSAANGTATYRVTVDEPPTSTPVSRWSPSAISRAVDVLTALGDHDPEPFIPVQCREMLEAAGYADVMAPLLDPARTDETIASLPPEVAPFLHAQTHATIAVVKVATSRRPLEVPGRVDITVEVGLLPGQDRRTADRVLMAALGPLTDGVGIELTGYGAPTTAPQASPLIDAFAAVIGDRDPAATVVPSMTNVVRMVTTAALREAGVAAYGLGTYSGRIPAPELGILPGNVDERLDVESITLLAELWPALVAHLRP